MTATLTKEQSEKRRAYIADYHGILARDSRNVGSEDYRIKDPRRRSRCSRNFRSFLKNYSPAPFYLKFGGAHVQLIRDVESVMLEGGNVVVAMPRGSGKTTILSRALVWSCLFGHRVFPILATANDSHFKRLLAGLKTFILTSDPLLEDFPEVIAPLREIRGNAARVRGQHYNGRETYVVWSAEMVGFPCTEISHERGNGGVTMAGGGITGALRGLQRELPTGEIRRPDVALFDDVQTRSSAMSAIQTDQRDQLVTDCIAMAGPNKPMASLMACTVIAKGDLSERHLDDSRPHWRSHRVKTLDSFPADLDLWKDYFAIRRRELLNEVRAGSSNKFYRKNRKAMDKGAQHFWPQLIDPGDLSAVQSAMNKWQDSPRAFMSEYQNEPERRSCEGELPPLSAAEIILRTRPVPRGEVPRECSIITAHIDVQQNILFWMVCGFTEKFGPHLVDLGTFPQRSESYFALTQVDRGANLARLYPDHDVDGRCILGITTLIKELDGVWKSGERSMRLSKILVDAGYNPEAVETGVTNSGCSNAAIAKGVGITANRLPLAEWRHEEGQVSGFHWLTRPKRTGMPVNWVNVNYWKTQVYQSLKLPAEHAQGMTLYEAPPSFHQMFADHCCSEIGVLKGKVTEWDHDGNTDNHYFDDAVGCFAAASMAGIEKPGLEEPEVPAIIIENGPIRIRTR